MAFHAVTAGKGDQYIACGVESVSRAGLGEGMPDEMKHPELDGFEGSLFDVYIATGLTAENVAQRCSVSREAQGEWAVTSQNRAVDAERSGHFDKEIVPVSTPDGEVARDAGPRPGTTMQVLGGLKPAFREDGSDRRQLVPPQRRHRGGARHVRVKARENGLTPNSRIIASSVAAIRPEIMGLGPIPVVKAVLEQAGMTIEDVDVLELNEAFAAQVVPCRGMRHRRREAQPLRRRDRPRPPVRDDRGAHHDHPAQRPRDLDGTIGLESMCVAGGMGQAMIVGRLS